MNKRNEYKKKNIFISQIIKIATSLYFDAAQYDIPRNDIIDFMS